MTAAAAPSSPSALTAARRAGWRRYLIVIAATALPGLLFLGIANYMNRVQMRKQEIHTRALLLLMESYLELLSVSSQAVQDYPFGPSDLAPDAEGWQEIPWTAMLKRTSHSRDPEVTVLAFQRMSENKILRSFRAYGWWPKSGQVVFIKVCSAGVDGVWSTRDDLTLVSDEDTGRWSRPERMTNDE